MNQKVPQHVAIIMDGNGRWAERQGISRSKGHIGGVEAVRGIVTTCVEEKIKTLSLFAFGQDNWKRPEEEVDFLMQLFFDALEKEIEELHEKGVRLSFLGDKSALDEALQVLIKAVESLTKNNSVLNLNVFVNYSGRWDIVQACQNLAKKVAEDALSVEDITEEVISNALITRDFKDPDLFIRTSGEQRISNFFLWQLVYSEFYFTEVHWPDFTPDTFRKALDWYATRERRFGKTSKQITEAHNA